MTGDYPDSYLLSDLHLYNPWWNEGADAFETLDIPTQYKSNFHPFAEPDTNRAPRPDKSDVYALVGQRGVGKTVLVRQFIRQRIAEDGIPPQNILYIPFDENPLYQLQSDTQLRQAINYYEGRILSQVYENDAPQYLILDDVHRIEHPNKSLTGWGDEIVSALEGSEDRHVILTASAEAQIERELSRVGVEGRRYEVYPVLPEKFRDHVQTTFPELATSEERFSPRSLRQGETGLPTACESGEPERFFEELRARHSALNEQSDRIRSQVADYLALGGVLGYEHPAVDSARDLDTADYHDRRESVQLSLYQEVPGLDAVKNIADLERLCALTATEVDTPIRYGRLTDLFDVDRRTLRESYFEVLKKLFLLTPSPEYDNSRPRSIRLYLRETALVNAYTGRSPGDVFNDYQLEARLARVAAFDHSMRLSFNMSRSAAREYGHDVPDEPTVAYWPGSDGEVAFVVECAGVSVPIGFAYGERRLESTTNAVEEFIDTYDVPLGLVVAGDATTRQEPVEILETAPIARIPYWFYLMLA